VGPKVESAAPNRNGDPAGPQLSPGEINRGAMMRKMEVRSVADLVRIVDQLRLLEDTTQNLTTAASIEASRSRSLNVRF